MSRHKFTLEEKQRGGRATARKLTERKCPKCGKWFDRHVAYAGHLGLHTFADRYCGGSMRLAAKKFNLLGIAATDSFPQNGAFREAHRVSLEIRGKP